MLCRGPYVYAHAEEGEVSLKGLIDEMYTGM